MIEPADLRADLEIQPNDVLMRMIALCKEILMTRDGQYVPMDATAVLRVGSEYSYAQPWPAVILVLPQGSPLSGERLTVRTSTYFPKGS